MSFDSWQAFWAMGKYGVYVWLSVGIFLVIMLGLVLRVFWQRKHIIQTLRSQWLLANTAKNPVTSEWSL